MLALASAFFPTHWYEILPRSAKLPPRPFDGTTLLRLTFLLEAIILALLGFTGWRPGRRESAGSALYDSGEKDISRRTAFWLVTLVTVLATALRFYKLGADLWLDEIATIEAYAARPLLEIFGSYMSPGNHLLNSLLVRISYSIFGISEWSVRLPAVILGILTIPAIYFAARLAMSRAASVGAALILALSYHHIFFSQNSRGYSGYLLFVVLGSALLASLIEKDSAGKWIAYVLAMTLSFVALMTTAFALLAHVIVGTIALYARHRRGLPVRPLAEQLLLAFGATGLLAFQIYAVSIPDVIAIYPLVYKVQGSGYVFFSAEFIRELARGITAGFGSPILLVPILAIGAASFWVLKKRNWAIAASLALTVFVTVAYLLLRGQSIAPRLLLPVVPLAVLSCMATVDILARQPRLALAAGAAIAAASIVLLPSYYSAPKQPFRAAIQFLESSYPHDEIVIPYPGDGGFEYYVSRSNLRDSLRYRYVRSEAQYDSLIRDNSRPKVLATTLFRVTRSANPRVAARIEDDWTPVKSLRGTLGDGSVVIWERRASASTR